MRQVETIKPTIGVTILVICLFIFSLIALARFFRISRPVFFVENIAEIAILTFVSMLMSILLILS